MVRSDILCDSGAFISLTSSCLDQILYFLHEKYNTEFIIPNFVEEECVNRPLNHNLKAFYFSALKIKNAINRNVITKVNSDVMEKGRKIQALANNLFYMKGKPLTLIQLGEAEMIALARELDIPILLVDERTTRMLIEAPFKMKEHLENEFNVTVMLNKKNLREFTDITKTFKVIRSSELVMLAYENGFFNSFSDMKKQALEAALYRVKFSGCSISFDEIETYLKSVV